MRRELTSEACAEMARLGKGLSAEDPHDRAAAALELARTLGDHGLSIGGLLQHRRLWGARPDLSRACDAFAAHFAGEALPVAERQGWSEDVQESLEMIRDVDVGRTHPSDVIRALGLFAVAFSSILDPDIPELQAE